LANPVTPAPASTTCQSCDGKGYWIRARRIGHRQWGRIEMAALDAINRPGSPELTDYSIRPGIVSHVMRQPGERK